MTGNQEMPDWADYQLSHDLPLLRSRGESQELEYIQAFPQNTRELAKEIAAFATSNTGTILLGVSDSGDLIGLQGIESPEGRDRTLQRLGGICRGTVKPSITPSAKFAVEGGKIVLVITVPKGRQPVYYADNVPHVRHLTESRPAEPHEVLELFREFFVAGGFIGATEKRDKGSEFYSSLGSILINILIFADEAREREFNPWLDMWRSEFGYAASELRNLAVQDVAIEGGIDSELNQLADNLDSIAKMQLFIGSGSDLDDATAKAADLVRTHKAKLIDPIPLSEDSLRSIRELLKTTSRKLENLKSRAQAMVESGQIEELQAEASRLGRIILSVAYYILDEIRKGLSDELQKFGHELHLVETMQLYIDGGLSAKAIEDRVVRCSDRLKELLATL